MHGRGARYNANNNVDHELLDNVVSVYGSAPSVPAKFGHRLERKLSADLSHLRQATTSAHPYNTALMELHKCPSMFAMFIFTAERPRRARFRYLPWRQANAGTGILSWLPVTVMISVTAYPWKVSQFAAQLSHANPSAVGFTCSLLYLSRKRSPVHPLLMSTCAEAIERSRFYNLLAIARQVLTAFAASKPVSASCLP